MQPQQPQSLPEPEQSQQQRGLESEQLPETKLREMQLLMPGLQGGPSLSSEVETLMASMGSSMSHSGNVVESGVGQACWRDGYTFQRCCEVPSIVAQLDGCWGGEFNENRCCGKKSGEVLAASASKVVGPEDNALDDEQAQESFFQREAERRWGTYFNQAHRTLNIAEHGNEHGQGDEPQSLESTKPDAVQIYHLLYEAVNQVVGGLQLAAEAASSAQVISKGTHWNGASSLQTAFLSAAVVLARLSQVSRGTPLEMEDFEAQASAAVTLSCQNQEVPDQTCQDLAHRIQWLRNQKASEVEMGRAHGWQSLLELLQRRQNASNQEARSLEPIFQRSWHMYAEDLAQAIWRPATGHHAQEESGEGAPSPPRASTFNPLERAQLDAGRGSGEMWQLFPTYVMAKDLSSFFSESSQNLVGQGCSVCARLAGVVLKKYREFRDAAFGGAEEIGKEARRTRQDEINNAFFNWQLTHDSEQEDVQAQSLWPELYRDSDDFRELKQLLKLACLEYLQQVYAASLSALDLAQLELSIWASVTPGEEDIDPSQSHDARHDHAMGLAFHDHPLALLSGVFYAQAGGRGLEERTPTVFADPRGTTPFRYAGGQTEDGTLEPTAPFHRLAYAHASDGLSIVFPSWLVHGVPPHRGSADRVVFAFNMHTLQGTTLSSWAKTTL